jgi:hypothetical protein
MEDIMPVYIINADNFTAESRFTNRKDADAAVKDKDFEAVIVGKIDDLKTFKGAELKKLAINAGMEDLGENKIPNIGKYRKEILAAIETNVFNIKKGASTKAKPKGKPRLGRYIKQGLLTGLFNDLTNTEATAKIDEAKAAGEIDERDMDKDTKTCLLWYRNNLKDNPTVAPPKVDPVEEAEKAKVAEEKKKRMQELAAKKKAKADAEKKAEGKAKTKASE